MPTKYYTFAGSISDLQLGDWVNFGKGPAIVTVIMPAIFQTKVVTTKGELICGSLTRLLIARPVENTRQIKDEH